MASVMTSYQKHLDLRNFTSVKAHFDTSAVIDFSNVGSSQGNVDDVLTDVAASLRPFRSVRYLYNVEAEFTSADEIVATMLAPSQLWISALPITLEHVGRYHVTVSRDRHGEWLIRHLAETHVHDNFRDILVLICVISISLLVLRRREKMILTSLILLVRALPFK